jgi:hypothetical protein
MAIKWSLIREVRYLNLKSAKKGNKESTKGQEIKRYLAKRRVLLEREFVEQKKITILSRRFLVF